MESRYNIGYNTDYTNLELAGLIILLMGKNPDDFIEFVKDRKGHDLVYKINSSKIQDSIKNHNALEYDYKYLGFKPLNLREGLIKTIDWYKQNRLWWETLL
jgi:dTDP-glucose 4,6-dehydratase